MRRPIIYGGAILGAIAAGAVAYQVTKPDQETVAAYHTAVEELNQYNQLKGIVSFSSLAGKRPDQVISKLDDLVDGTQKIYSEDSGKRIAEKATSIQEQIQDHYEKKFPSNEIEWYTFLTPPGNTVGGDFSELRTIINFEMSSYGESSGFQAIEDFKDTKISEAGWIGIIFGGLLLGAFGGGLIANQYTERWRFGSFP